MGDGASELDGRQRKHLRGLAHALEPIVQVGKGLVSDQIVGQIDRALEAHELIKVRFLGGKDDKSALTAELSTRTASASAGGVGHIVILYREQRDPKKRRVRLPD